MQSPSLTSTPPPAPDRRHGTDVAETPLHWDDTSSTTPGGWTHGDDRPPTAPATSQPYDTEEIPPVRPPAPSGTAGGGAGRGRLVAVALVAAVTGAAVAAPTAAWVVRDSAPAEAADTAPATTVASEAPVTAAPQDAASEPVPAFDAAAIAATVTPSVVRVDVAGAAGSGSGSGVVWDQEGTIVTNNHVVQGASTVRVTTSDGQDLQARVVGTWPAADLAVISVDAQLEPIEVASAPARIGEQVLAVGSPFGLDGSVTAGIVSAVGRTVNTSGTALTNLVQTDAAINPGNSGGALVDSAGQLLGINTVIATSGGGSDGIGFAIDAATVTDVVTDLADDGTVSQAVLGVTGAEIADPSLVGALITSVVPGSAADDGGLVAGDLVTGVDGDPVTSFAELAARIIRHDPGDEISLSIMRSDGGTDTVSVTLGSQGG